MWFKQLQVYSLKSKVENNPETLAQALESLLFSKCSPNQPSSHGWVSPIDKDEAPLVHAANGYSMICLQIEEKLLPATVIRQSLEERVKEIEAQRESKISRNEKAQIKDSVIFSLMPRAFTKLTRVYAYFDRINHCMILNTTNKRHLELFIDALDKTLPDLDFTKPETKKMTTVMTNWLLNSNIPKSFELEMSCVLQDPSQQARTVRVSHQDLDAKPIHGFLKEGCEVKQIALCWQDRVSFTLSDDFLIRGIKFSDTVKETAAEYSADDESQKFDADYYIMTQTLSELLQDIFQAVLKKEKQEKKQVAESA